MPNAAFLQELTALVQRQRTIVATDWAALPDAVLMAQPGPGRWSALECVEHLNRYSCYYNPALAAALERVETISTNAGPKPICYSWLGRKSVALVRPTNVGTHKTLSRMNPSTAPQPQREVLQEFVGHQAQLLNLLSQATNADLNCRAVPVEFFRLLKLRLGEAFEFVVQHQERHLLQGGRAIRQGIPGAEIVHSVT